MSEDKKATGYNPKDLIGMCKPNIGLLPMSSIIAAADCMADGAKKYGPFNWRETGKAVHYTVYINAAFRHLAAFLDGEERASDSKKSHLAHAIAGLCVLYDAIAVGNACDDRPLPGAAPRLIAELTTSQAPKIAE